MSVKRREIVKLMVALFMCAGVLGSFGFGKQKLRVWQCDNCGAQRQSADIPRGNEGGICPKPYPINHLWKEVK